MSKVIGMDGAKRPNQGLKFDPKDLKDDVVKKMGGGYMGGMFSGDEVLAAGNSKGGRKALRGIKFKGVL